MENIIQNVLDVLTGLAQSLAELARHFIQTQSVQEKYSDAHQIVVPLVLVFFLILYWVDRYDTFWEKFLYTIYFILGIEALVFIAVLISSLAQ